MGRTKPFRVCIEAENIREGKDTGQREVGSAWQFRAGHLKRLKPFLATLRF